INPSLQVLRMANWVARSCESISGPYKEMRGAAYYELASGWVRNPAYGNPPPLRTVKAKGHLALGLAKREEIYGLLRSDPDRLAFLTRPQDFKEFFQGLLE
ncbi:MAG: glucose-6-phosphate isomerase, partial [Candidatus Hydrothermarchaeota archaeon]